MNVYPFSNFWYQILLTGTRNSSFGYIWKMQVSRTKKKTYRKISGGKSPKEAIFESKIIEIYRKMSKFAIKFCLLF